MADGNRAVVFANPQDMQVENLDFPKLEMPDGAKAPHGVILKIVATNICGSDLHIYRGSFPVPQGMVMGHEMTGQVVELGSDVTFLKEGDLVSVPFNVACGRCRNCRARRTEVCETTNPDVSCGAWVQSRQLARWTGGIPVCALCRLSAAPLPRQGPGHGEDPRLGPLVETFSYSIPWSDGGWCHAG